MSTPTEPNWIEIVESLTNAPIDDLEVECDHWRQILRVIERLKPESQAGHSIALGRLRLAERALTKAKQDAR